ncbi:hypothetical protein LEH94_16185 [Salmonella enterica]|nr:MULTISPECIES: hypothetical protein [Salmonella]MCW6816568.1 hypothetical protein [Salmonella enterica]MCW6820772.1 hypothetical protein [Salmonella enterica]MCW6834622.1 hypothetical protein [Salmonella enterica subsp. arizonae]MDJ3551638.1 hypothetical protein [Salmonella enterica]MDJ3586093.1 hypothetical protein [Salmonella enterica]
MRPASAISADGARAARAAV